MKSLLYIAFLAIMGIGGYFYFLGNAYDPTRFYNRSGEILKPKKIWIDTFAIASATPTLSISSAGFSTIISVQSQIIQSSPTLSNFTWCNATSYSTSSVTLFLAQENSSTVNILGSLVLLGTPLQAPSSFSNMFVSLEVIGY